MATKADSFGEKIKVLGEAVAKLLGESNKMKQKLYELEIDIEGRMDWKSGKQEMKKKHQKVKEQMDQKVGGIELNFESHKQELKERIADIDWKMNELKLNTLKEFEDYRAKDARVNADFASEVSKRVEEKILRELIQKNKMSQDIKKEVIHHFNIENEIKNHNIERRLNALEEEYQYLLNLISGKVEKSEIQELRRKIEEIQGSEPFEVPGTMRGDKVKEASESGVQQKVKNQGLQIKELREAEKKEQSGEGVIIEKERASRDLMLSNEMCGIRERLNDLEVREVELNQRLEGQFRKIKLELVAKKDKGLTNDWVQKQQLLLNQNLQSIKDSVNGKIRELERKVLLISDQTGQFSSLQGDGLTRVLKILNSKAGADDVREFILSNEFKIQKINDKLRVLSFEVQKNARVIQNIVGLIKGVGGGGEFNNILLSTKGLQCLSCGRNEYGKVVLNNAPRGYTHGSSPYRSLQRADPNEPRGIQISPHIPRRYNISDGEGSLNQSARSKSPDFLNRSNKLLVGSAKLSLDEYMSKTAELFLKRDLHSQPSDTFGVSVRSSLESPQLQGNDPRVQTEHTYEKLKLRREIHSKSPFAEERERHYLYQSPSLRSSTPS